MNACAKCGGTILAPTVRGVPRGTCRCPRFPACCLAMIARYEAMEISVAAKARGGVALHCDGCAARVTFNNEWRREGA
jgi:hypothetical protein